MVQRKPLIKLSVWFHVLIGLLSLVSAVMGMYIYLHDGDMASHSEGLIMIVVGGIGLLLCCFGAWSYSNDEDIAISVMSVIQFGVALTIIVLLSLISKGMKDVRQEDGSNGVAARIVDYGLSMFHSCCAEVEENCPQQDQFKEGHCPKLAQCEKEEQKKELIRECFASSSENKTTGARYHVGLAACNIGENLGIVGPIDAGFCGEGKPLQFLQEFLDVMSSDVQPALNGIGSVVIILLIIQIAIGVILLGVFVPSKDDVGRGVRAVSERIQSVSGSLRNSQRGSKSEGPPENGTPSRFSSRSYNDPALASVIDINRNSSNSRGGNRSSVKSAPKSTVSKALPLNEPLSDDKLSSNSATKTREVRQEVIYSRPTSGTYERSARSHEHSGRSDRRSTDRSRAGSKSNGNTLPFRPRSVDGGHGSSSHSQSFSPPLSSSSIDRARSRSAGGSRKNHAGSNTGLVRYDSNHSNASAHGANGNPRDRVVSVGSWDSGVSAEALADMTLEHYEKCVEQNPELLAEDDEADGTDFANGFLKGEHVPANGEDEDDEPLHMSLETYASDMEQRQDDSNDLDDYLQREAESVEPPSRPPSRGMHREASTKSVRSTGQKEHDHSGHAHMERQASTGSAASNSSQLAKPPGFFMTPQNSGRSLTSNSTQKKGKSRPSIFGSLFGSKS